MGLATNAPEEWQLLASVHPIFAFKSPSIEPFGQSESDREILKNLETVFEFEIWLLPDALQEAQAYSLSENASQEGILALASLLGLFEDYVDERVFDFYQQRFRTPLLGTQVCHLAHRFSSFEVQHLLIRTGLSKATSTAIRTKPKTWKPERQSFGSCARTWISGLGWNHH